MGTIYIGRYKVIEELGRGGMGVVYRGEDPVLERQVAIKVLPPKKMTPKSIERFLREAKTAARLDSPYIVKIHDIGQIDDIHFIVMEYVEGSSLSDMIEYEVVPGSEDLRKRLKIFRQVLEAVRYAHENGVVHRDLKPDNIMVNKSGHVKVMDFGLAFFAGQHSLTEVGQIMGTAAYVSPEQAAGKLTDPRTDIYSLGVILFELITGRWPFSASNPLEMFRKVAEEPAPSPRVYNKSISPALETIVLRCLRKRPDDRFLSIADLIDSFEICLKKEISDSGTAIAGVPAPGLDKLAGQKTPSRLPAPSSARFGNAKAGGTQGAPASQPSGVGGDKRLPSPHRHLPIEHNSANEPQAPTSSGAEQASRPVAGEPAQQVGPGQGMVMPRSRAAMPSSRGRSPVSHRSSGRPVIVNSAAAYNADVARQNEQRKASSRRGGVVTIGGEAAFRTSVASYESQFNDYARQEPSGGESGYTEMSAPTPEPTTEPVQPPSMPAPGPALRQALQETSVAAPDSVAVPAYSGFQAEETEPVEAAGATAVSVPEKVKTGAVKIPVPDFGIPSAEPKADKGEKSDRASFGSGATAAVPSGAASSNGGSESKDEPSDGRRFVGGSGAGIASNAWMANVDDKPAPKPADGTSFPAGMMDMAGDERTTEVVIQSGWDAYDNYRLDEAASEFKLVLDRDPGNMQGLLGLGKVALENEEFEKSRSYLEQATQVAPDSSEPYVALADFFARTEQPASVISALHKALDRNEYDAVLRCRLAFLYFEQNRPEVAFEQYCVALEQAQQDLQVNYQLAIFLNSQNRLNEAVPCLERACAVQPQNADLHSYFADVYLRLGKPMLAQEVLESALNAGVAVNADVHADWAALYIALNNEKDAITELGAALEEEPGHCRASVELSSMFCKHNQLAEAVKILEQALNYHPNSLLLHRRLGEVYILGNVLDKAMDHFEQIVQLDPICAEVYNRLSRVYLKKHYDITALDRYQKAVEEHPVTPSYREDLAMAYYCSGQYQAAIAELVKACRLDYTNPDYPKSLGLILLDLGAYEDAMRQFQSSLSLRPEDTQTRGMLGKALAGQGFNNLAIVEFQKAIDNDPDMYLFNLPLARAYLMQGRKDQAVLCFKRFLNTIPDTTGLVPLHNAYLGVGRCLIRQNQLAFAVDVFECILQRNPYNEDAYLGLVKVCMEQKNYSRANRYVDEGLKAAPHYAPLLLAKADVYAAQERWSAAVPILLEATQAAPRNYHIIEQLGRAYRKCGRFQDAIDVFTKSAEEFPDQAAHFTWLRGRVLYRQGQYEASAWAYKQAMELDPTDWHICLDLGKAYTSLQQLDEAAQVYRTAEQLAPAEEKNQIRSLLNRLRR